MHSEEHKSRGKQWLFGIGISNYAELPNLANAVKDVKDIIQVLTEDYGVSPSKTITLFDEEANRENLIHQLDILAGKVGEDDNLLIYFAGHGYLNKVTDMGYWIPHDAKKGKTSLYIGNSTIRDYIKAFKTKHTLLIVDSCFSGSFFLRGVSRSNVALQELESIPSRWAICSGRSDEEVSDGIRGENSPFAQSILDALRDNTNKLLNVAKVADRVVEQTRANFEQLPEGNPIQGVGHKGGQYIFHRKAKEEKFWEECQRKDDPSGYSRYLRQFPEGKYTKQATARLKQLEELIAWKDAEKLGTISALRSYITVYPYGKFVEEAQNKILIVEKRLDRWGEEEERFKGEQARAEEVRREAEKGKSDTEWARPKQEGEHPWGLKDENDDVVEPETPRFIIWANWGGTFFAVVCVAFLVWAINDSFPGFFTIKRPQETTTDMLPGVNLWDGETDNQPVEAETASAVNESPESVNLKKGNSTSEIAEQQALQWILHRATAPLSVSQFLQFTQLRLHEEGGHQFDLVTENQSAGGGFRRITFTLGPNKWSWLVDVNRKEFLPGNYYTLQTEQFLEATEGRENIARFWLVNKAEGALIRSLIGSLMDNRGVDYQDTTRFRVTSQVASPDLTRLSFHVSDLIVSWDVNMDDEVYFAANDPTAQLMERLNNLSRYGGRSALN